MSLSLDVLHRLRPAFRSALPSRAACWLGLSPDRIVLHHPLAEQPWQVAPGPHNHWDMEAALDAWDSLWQAASLQRQPLRVMVSDHWTTGIALTLPDGIQAEDDIRRFAHAELRQRFGDGMDPWHVDWSALNHSILAIACPLTLIRRLQHTLASSQSQLAFLGSQSLETLRVLHAAPPSDRWCVVVSQRHLTLVCIQQEQFRGYWSHPRDGQVEHALPLLLERHHRLLGDAKGLVEVIDPHRFVPPAVWTSTLQAAGWTVATPALPISPYWTGPVNTWQQFVGREFS